MSKIFANGKRFVGTAAVCLMLVGWSFSSSAQVGCTIENWKVDDAPAAVGLDNSNVGQPSQTDANNRSFRRYAGPCGLRVPLDGQARYVRDGSPASESEYKARFYVFFNEVTQNILLYEAVDESGNPLIEIWYDHSNGTIGADIETAGGPTNLGESPVRSGWNSVQFQWGSVVESDGTQVDAVNVELVVNTSPPIRNEFDLNGALITEARLGNVSGASGGYIDFDDFDSRRVSAPGRLVRGDATGTGSVNSPDLQATRNEILGTAFASGQPDCNEDGVIGAPDLQCIRNIILGN